MSASILKVLSPNAEIRDDGCLYADYVDEKCIVETERGSKNGGRHSVRVDRRKCELRTDLRVPKVGLMLVGWGGNNGSTLTASLIANRRGLSWQTRRGVQHANYFGSVMLSSTVKLGIDEKSGEDVYVPIKDLLPMIDPNELVVGGWDISSLDLAAAMQRAQVLEPDLQRQVNNHFCSKAFIILTPSIEKCIIVVLC